jgi:hypothetical protein
MPAGERPPPTVAMAATATAATTGVLVCAALNATTNDNDHEAVRRPAEPASL